jgi:glycosyltransferase involved in cell wall biosynthesis
VHYFPVLYSNRMSFAQRVIAFTKFAMVAGRKTIEIGGDVVFASSTPLTIAVPAIRAIRSLGVPMVFEVRDLWPELPIAVGAIRSPISKLAARWLERRAYSASAAVVALSPGMAEGVARAGYPRERIHVIPNACDVELFQNPGLPLPWDEKMLTWLAAGPVVLYAGTLGIVNGVGYLVDVAVAAARMGSPVRFLVVGSGVEDGVVRERAEQAGVLGKNFRMMPPIAKACMPTILAQVTLTATLLINLPELGVSSGNKFFDSLAAGKPIAINYAGWQADLLNASGAGFLLPHDDPAAAANRLTEFIETEGAVAAAGQAALLLARQQFDRDLLAEKLLSVLQRVVNDSVAPVT